jgi:ubiquinone/menaquinone biosynthesis C-methylase UbiE
MSDLTNRPTKSGKNMKVRDSGMPQQEMWDSFFNPTEILKRLDLDKNTRDVVEFGSGYGTFTLIAASLISGKLYALDIEKEMINILKKKIVEQSCKNIEILQRDFITDGTGLKKNSVDYAMLFNILHHEKPIDLLKAAYRVLAPGGKAAIIHWIYSDATPRGPSLDIRPKPEQCTNWLRIAGFDIHKGPLSFPPYHYGIIGIKQ